MTRDDVNEALWQMVPTIYEENIPQIMALIDRYVAEKRNVEMQLDIQPVAKNVPLDEHDHVAEEICRGCLDLAGPRWVRLVAAKWAERERKLVELAIKLSWGTTNNMPSVDDVLAEFKRSEGE